MQPTRKSEGIESFLKRTFGVDRREAICHDRCISPPIGCGEFVAGFRDECSRKEFKISGLCQKCQDSVFGGE
jgi:hypothetical protein